MDECMVMKFITQLKNTHIYESELYEWRKVTILMKLIEWMKFNDVNDVDQDDEISKHG